MSGPAFLQLLAEVCSAAADLVLNPTARPAGPDAYPTPQLWHERNQWEERHGTSEPVVWTNEIASAYLAEAAHQVQAIGQLLRTATVTAALDPLERAAIERVGRVIWILDASIPTKQRGARAGLELGVSLQAYRKTLKQLKVRSDIQREFRTQDRGHRETLKELFAVIQPPQDRCDDNSEPSEQVETWTVDGERYINYSDLIQYVLPYDVTTKSLGRGLYSGLSGFSHPSVAYSREHACVSQDGTITYVYRYDHLKRDTRRVVLAMLEAALSWKNYCGAGPDEFPEQVEELEAWIAEISNVAAD